MQRSSYASDQIRLIIDGPVARIVFSRPAKLNAISLEMFTGFEAAFERAESTEDVRVIILAGDDRAFSAGADLAEMSSEPAAALEFMERSLTAISRPERSPLPVVAVVSGLALGAGFEICLAADIVVATSSARFGVPEPKVGLVPGFAVSRLPILVGLQAASRILLGGEVLSAVEAEGLGIVSDVVPDPEGAERRATELTRRVTECGPLAIRQLKEVLRGQRESMPALASMARANVSLLATDDAAEGLGAFREKRIPVFKGR